MNSRLFGEQQQDGIEQGRNGLEIKRIRQCQYEWDKLVLKTNEASRAGGHLHWCIPEMTRID
jgi:hypothetical protein